VRRVRSNGQIKWAGELIFVGEALVGEPVGVIETRAVTGWCVMPTSSWTTSIRSGAGLARVRCEGPVGLGI
jgi:hypothetical protein